ncbi:MAG: hypothetical protein ACLTDF_13310 [Coprococcus sp.]
MNSDCITQVGSGQSFDVISQDDKWVQIALDDETNGYVSTGVDDTYAFATAKSMEQIRQSLMRGCGRKGSRGAGKTNRRAQTRQKRGRIR